VATDQPNNNPTTARPREWTPHLTVGALVAVVVAAVQISWGVASDKELVAAEARIEKRVDAIWEELSRRERVSFRQSDWERGRAEIDKDLEFECRRPIARLETAMGHLRAMFPKNLPGSDEP